MKNLSLIVAMTQNSCIGKGNTLPWRQREDMKFFKKITTGKVVIMGRSTFDSLGQKPLPNRVNIVISTTLSKKDENGYLVAKNVDEALSFLNRWEFDAVIIGGASIYEQTLNKVNEMYITILNTEIEGDTFFPKLNFMLGWSSYIVMHGPADEFNDHAFTTYHLQKKD